MISKSATRINESLIHVKKISKHASLLLKIFLVMYSVVTIPMVCYGVFVVALSDVEYLDKLWFGLQIFPTVLTILVTLFVCITLIHLFASISNGDSPFTFEQAKRFKVVGWLLTASFFLALIASAAPLPYAQIDTLTLGLFVPTQNPSGIDINLAYVLCAIVSFSFSCVFKYGALLQQLSDDTV